jgi:hypothetical protein
VEEETGKREVLLLPITDTAAAIAINGFSHSAILLSASCS